MNPHHHADHRVLTDALRASVAQGSEFSSEAVAMLCIDDLTDDGTLDGVSFVKIDVQGYEPEVCAGLVRTLERNPSAYVAFEFAPGDIRAAGFDPEQQLRFFLDRSYELHVLSSGRSCSPPASGRCSSA